MKKSLHEDYSLWKCFIHGDDDAFASIYSGYIDVLYAYGKRHLDDEDLIQDCIQDMFIDLCQYRARLSPDVNIKFYLFSVLKHRINRCQKNIKVIEQESSSYDYQSSGTFNLCFSAEESLIRAEETTECLKPLIQEMNLLPSRQKEVLYLRFNAELEYEEIAALMKISVSSCRTMLFRAVKQLRKRLENSPAKNLLMLLHIII
ncbi:RNA polymerase sigma factor [Mucilaginibacter sp. X5P1]|uniref:RNA polymerase sigma factor n=1 Tax=Mucilaginibacter sp. X5P1 TaxID=2723088 RepID=UPI00160D13A6|nr:sigma-70 family RNA polymerase sigma factor [Mucilaginibacter sp. X5P1]MBB6141933.1 RNA polymerase sigma factor (sigma-70 family) [Mucilaginibacter sp. X5P1]